MCHLSRLRTQKQKIFHGFVCSVGKEIAFILRGKKTGIGKSCFSYLSLSNSLFCLLFLSLSLPLDSNFLLSSAGLLSFYFNQEQHFTISPFLSIPITVYSLLYSTSLRNLPRLLFLSESLYFLHHSPLFIFLQL